MNTSEHILSDQVILGPGQPSPRLLTLRRTERALSSALWSWERVVMLGTLMLTPLLFGAVQPWAWGGITFVATILLLMWGFGRVQRGSIRVLWSPLLFGICVALVFSVVQLWTGLSIDRVATREASIKLLTYGMIFFVTQQLYLSASSKTWRNTGIAVTAYMFAMAAFAMAQYFASPGLVYGYLAESSSVFGPYVNHGNYAGLMEMLIPMALCFAISLRSKHPAKPFVVFLAFVSVVSVFLSGSRAGLVSLAAECVILGAVMLSSQSNKRQVVVAGMAAACLAVALFYWLDPGETWGRWQQMASRPELALGNRQTIALDTLHMTREHLAHGVGLGAFQTAYTRYQTVATDLTIDYAHNDYLQFIAETGVGGIVLLALLLAVFFVLAFKGLQQRLRQSEGWLQFGASVGVCGLLVHSFSEFNLHIPANAAWFAFWAAVASLPVSPPRQSRSNHGHS